MSSHSDLPPGSLPQPRLLSAAEQQDYLTLMQMGAPPLLACQRVEVSTDDLQATLDADRDFAERLEYVEATLARNVQSAMYKAAMGGSVYAQVHYLRQCRPPKKPPVDEKLIGDLPSSGELRSILLKSLGPPEGETVTEGGGI